MRLYWIVIPAITLLVSVVGSAVTSAGMGWYDTLTLPVWTPSGAIIGTVWTVIFLLTTISALIVWRDAERKERFLKIIALFLINAALNVLWSLLFFGLHEMGWAVIESALLGVSVLALMVYIYPISRAASWLLAPYAVWVAFATYLTYTVWRLNS